MRTLCFQRVWDYLSLVWASETLEESFGFIFHLLWGSCFGFWCRRCLLSKEKKTHLFSTLWQRTDSLFLISELHIWAGQMCPFSLPLPRDEWQEGKCKGTEGKCNWSQGSAACSFCSTLEIHSSVFIYFHRLQIVSSTSSQHRSEHTAVGAVFPLCSPLFWEQDPASLHGIYYGLLHPELCFLQWISTSTLLQKIEIAAKFDGVSVQAELGVQSASGITVVEEALHKEFGCLGHNYADCNPRNSCYTQISPNAPCKAAAPPPNLAHYGATTKPSWMASMDAALLAEKPCGKPQS